jgi:hypothetical protein
MNEIDELRLIERSLNIQEIIGRPRIRFKDLTKDQQDKLIAIKNS